MDLQTLRNTLQHLSTDERTALVTMFRLFHDYTSYTEIHDYDLYTSIPTFDDFDHIHALMASLKTKRLIEVSEDEGGMHSVTKMLCTTDLNCEERHVFGTIVGFMHAFKKDVNFHNISGNVRAISEQDLPALLTRLAQYGLITLDEHYTVSQVFSGAPEAGIRVS